jgi:hypothetical protein
MVLYRPVFYEVVAEINRFMIYFRLERVENMVR